MGYGGYTPGYIYILRAGRYYKIGRTSDLDRRMKQLSKPGAVIVPDDLPRKPKLLHTVRTESAWWSEHALHHFFRHNRVVGEWFKLGRAGERFLLQLNEETIDEFRKLYFHMMACRLNDLTNDMHKRAAELGFRLIYVWD